LAVVAPLTKGYDLDYIWRQVDRDLTKDAAGYDIQASTPCGTVTRGCTSTPRSPTARTGTDGKWRTPDSLGYDEHVGSVAAIVAHHLEEALTGTSAWSGWRVMTGTGSRSRASR
jgi:hypothetical protein